MNIKQINTIAIAVVTAIFMTACGGSSSKSGDTTVTPKSTTLKGDLKDYFEVVDKEYKIKVDEGSFMKSGMITVEIKRNSTPFDFPTDNINPFGTNGSEDYHVGFGIEIFDESGPVVVKNATSGGMSGPYSSDDVTSLMKLGDGESGFIRWSVSGDEVEGLTSFQISSALEKSNRSSYSSSSSSSSTSSSTNSGGEDWDAVLKSYETYIDQYIKLMKKAKDGDASAMTEYAEMMQNATDLAEKMESAGDDLSTTQMNKFLKLQTKLTNAAMEMY